MPSNDLECIDYLLTSFVNINIIFEPILNMFIKSIFVEVSILFYDCFNQMFKNFWFKIDYFLIFKEIFETEFKNGWDSKFKAAGIHFMYTLVDDVVARIMKTEGGVLWACKNYDGDVMSDMLASANGSLAMRTSVLVSPQGHFEYEAAHGTVQKHYYKHLAGEKTSTNSMALIFAWTGCLRKRGELDNTPEVVAFADKLETAALETIENGIMTGDLLAVADPSPSNKKVLTGEFIDAIAANLVKKL